MKSIHAVARPWARVENPVPVFKLREIEKVKDYMERQAALAQHGPMFIYKLGGKKCYIIQTVQGR